MPKLNVKVENLVPLYAKIPLELRNDLVLLSERTSMTFNTIVIGLIIRGIEMEIKECAENQEVRNKWWRELESLVKVQGWRL